ncbi:hypothetical protein ACFQZC_03440 [Streptacidiphilus monticola]
MLRGVLAVVLVCCLWVGWSVYGALAAPGTDSTSARLAEWGRDHGLDWAVNWLEVQTYSPPAAGGAVPPDALARMRAAQRQQSAARSAVRLHAPIRPLVSPALPGEGDFVPLVEEHGEPVVQSATMRPDTQYTSFPVGVVWMKQRALTFSSTRGSRSPAAAGRSRTASVPATGAGWSPPTTAASR